MNISLSPFAPENLVSRDRFGSPVPRQPAHLHTQAESGAYLRDSFGIPQRRPHIIMLPTDIGSVPGLSDHAVAYRWRSLPRVRRHRASSPQRRSKRVLPWQVTMDQLICAFLFPHPLLVYDVGMLKVEYRRLLQYTVVSIFAGAGVLFFTSSSVLRLSHSTSYLLLYSCSQVWINRVRLGCQSCSWWVS